jgi:hypothetical protein
MVSPKRSKIGRLVLVVIAMLGIGGVGFAAGTGRLAPLLSKIGVMPVPAATEEAAVPAPSASAADPSEAASASPEPDESAEAPRASASADQPTAPPTGVVTSTPAPQPQAAAEPRPSPGGRSQPAPEKEEPASTSAFAASAPPFSAQAAKSSLGAAAASAGKCKEAGGPTGTGRVSITFASSGRPTSVAVTGDLAGTTVGSCVARLFRGARVPAFSGEPVTVSKSFAVE